MGVRSVGIVDFDVLNDRTEFDKQLGALGLDETERTLSLSLRDQIAQAAKEIDPSERLNSVKTQCQSLLQLIVDAEVESDSEAENRTAKEKVLKLIERKCSEIGDTTKNWKVFKEKGRGALLADLQTKFDALWSLCAKKGLFINPVGELESMLVDYGTPYTTDKRSWITGALQLVSGLAIDDKKYPWKFIKAIHDHLHE